MPCPTPAHLRKAAKYFIKGIDMLNGIGAAAARRHSFAVCAGVATVGMVALFAMRPALAAYEVVTVTNGGTIDGVVTLSGTAPTEAPIKVTKNQDFCGQTIPDPAYTVDSSGGLANVIVYLKDITKGKGAPTEPLALKGFSVTKPLPGMPMMIKVKCDAHEWMHAWIMELDHPYFATTGSDGHFTIKDVPPGTYTLAVWHELAGEKSAPVVVAAGQTVKSKITLAAK